MTNCHSLPPLSKKDINMKDYFCGITFPAKVDVDRIMGAPEYWLRNMGYVIALQRFERALVK